MPNETSSYDAEIRFILTMMDDSSRFLRAVAIPCQHKDVVLQAFEDNWIAIFEYPKELINGRARQLIGSEMKSLLKEGNGISIPKAAYFQEASAVERLHHTLGQRLRSLTSVLAYAVHSYNVTKNSITDQALFTMLLTKEIDNNTLSSSKYEGHKHCTRR